MTVNRLNTLAGRGEGLLNLSVGQQLLDPRHTVVGELPVLLGTLDRQPVS